MKRKTYRWLSALALSVMLFNEVGSLPVVWAADKDSAVCDQGAYEDSAFEYEAFDGGIDLHFDEVIEAEEATEELAPVDKDEKDQKELTGEDAGGEEKTEEVSQNEAEEGEDGGQEEIEVQAASEGDFTYTTSSDSDHTYATITKYNGTATSVIIPDTIGGYPVESIGASAFTGNASLVKVEIPDAVKSIGNYAFQNCTKLSDVELPLNLETLGMYALKNTAISSIRIPKSLKSCAGGAFHDCKNLETAEFEEGITQICANLFNGAPIKTITIPNGVTSIGNSAFRGCSSLVKAEIPDTVTNIENYAFQNCTKLSDVELPINLETMGLYVLKNTAISSIRIPKSLKSCAGGVFHDCKNLETAEIEEGITQICANLFNGAPIKTITIPNGVTSIGSSAFSGCSSLVKAEIPDTVTNIESYAFQNCTKLSDVELPINLETMGLYVLKNTAISSIRIPKSLKSCAGGAFQDCKDLETAEIEEGITQICANLFNGAPIKTITIPNGVTSIGSSAFSACSSLVKAEIPDTVTNIESYAFQNCTKLSDVELPLSLETMGLYVFKNTAISSIRIPKSLKSCADRVFEDCENLETVDFEEGITQICPKLFDYSPIKEITIPYGVTSIGDNAFHGCSSLVKIIVPSTVTNFGKYVFSDCPDLCIYGYTSSYAFIFALDNNIDFHPIGAVSCNSAIVDMANTRFYTSSESAVKNGFIPMTLSYSIPESIFESLTNSKIIVTFSNNLELIENSVTLNGNQLKSYGYSKKSLTIDNVTEANGTLQFYATPVQTGMLFAYTQFSCTQNGTSHKDIIGVICLDAPQLKLNIPSETSQSSFGVTGVTSPSEVVVFDINGVNVGTAKSKKDGTFSTTVTIPNTPVSGTTYTITGMLQSNSEVTSSEKILYKEGIPTLTQFDMHYTAHSPQKLDLLNADGTQLTNAINPAKPLKFVVKFDNYESLETVLIASTKGGVTNTMKAEKTDNPGEYIAEGFFDGAPDRYVPGTVNVCYYTSTTVDEYTRELSLSELPEEWRDSTTTVIKDTENEYLATISLADDGGEVEFEVLENVSLASLRASLLSEDSDMYSSEEMVVTADDDDWEAVESFFEELHKRYKKNVVSNFKDIRSEKGDILAVINDDAAGSIKYVFFDSAKKAFTKAGVNYAATYVIQDKLWIAGSWAECSSLWGITSGLGSDVIHGVKTGISIRAAKAEIESLGLDEWEEKQAIEKIDNLKGWYVATNILRVTGTVAGFGLKASGHPLLGTLASTVLKGVADLVETYYLDKALIYYKSGGQGSFLKWLIDPSGYVYDVYTDQRIEGVTTSAYWIPYDENDADFWNKPPTPSEYGELWDASEYSQQNPLITDVEGCYAWEVPEGWWRVKYEMEGYETVWSDWMSVPPIRTEVNIGMKSIGGPVINLESVSLNKTSLSMLVGDEQKLTYSFNPTNAFATTVSVNSSAADVATAVVDTKSKEISVTALKPGTAVITLTADGCTATCSVTVTKKGGDDPIVVSNVSAMNPVPVIDETTTEIHLVKGQKFTLSESGWECKEKKILTVNKKNVVTAKKVTTTPVKLTKGDRSIDVYITKPAMSSKTVELSAGRSQSIGFNYDKENLPVLYYSNAPDVATVSENGAVTAVAKGTATVTAYVNGSAYSCKVKVKENTPAAERTLHMTLMTNKTISIKGVKKVTWVCDDESIVSVAKNNKIRANTTGETVLRTEYEGKEYRIHVFVEDPTITTKGIQSAGKNKYKINMASGASTAIEFVSVDQPVVFKSSKGDRAYVDEDGVIHANVSGKAKLTAKVNGKTITITVTVQ